MRRSRRSAAAATLILLACMVLLLGRSLWQPAGLELPGEIRTNDPTPQLQVALGNGIAPAAHATLVTIDGRRVPATVSVAAEAMSISLPQLADGRHRIVLSAPNRGPIPGTQQADSVLVVDTAPPSAKVRSTQRIAAAGRASVTIRVETERGATAQLTSQGKTIELVNFDGVAVSSLELDEGPHKVAVELSDAAGNRRTVRHVIWADSTAPRVRSDSLLIPDHARPSITAAVSDNRPPAQLRAMARIDGSEVPARIAAGKLVARPSKPLSEGRHELTLTVIDQAGNEGTLSRSFTVDTTETLGAATLRAGARGADVLLLQRELMRPSAWEATPPSLSPSGIYDEATAAAIEAFQAKEGLDVDGVAGPFTIAALTLRVAIDQSEHRLVLYRYGRMFRSYRIAVGQPKYPTPNGSYRIVDKQKNPTWTPPDSEWAKDEKVTPPGPDNPLGTRWMGLDSPGIGIHGTNSPESLGYSVSHGCIRMSIPDVEELYELVEEGTRVQISP